MPKLTIDGMELEVAAGTSILQACEQLGIEIPRFCYHDKLSVPANCRMCLVEMQGAPKPVASCAMPCADNMVIKTDSELTLKARKGVMEFLLINHPLDCPICDQGGECDLQDQAMGYGFDRGRFDEQKRAVKDKYMGPLIKTFMTRCIQCTRCIRFADEIAGVAEIGFLGRSEDVEISTLEKAVASELSGNLVDVCPVGALTSRPYQFVSRPWELRKTDGIDVMDAVGSNIRIDARGNEVLRILPRLNESINEDWLADKSRYACDGLTRQRLDKPYLRIGGRLRPVSWEIALTAAAEKLTKAAPARIAAIGGDLIDCESSKALVDLMTGLGVNHLDCRQDGAEFDVSQPAGYLFNSTIEGIEQADAILIVGDNTRWGAPLINARIRKRYLAGNVSIAVIGEKRDLTYPYQHLGTGVETLRAISAGTHDFSQTLRAAKNPMLIIGAAVFIGAEGMALHRLVCDAAVNNNLIRDGWNGFNMIHRAAGRVGAIQTGFVPRNGGKSTRQILSAAKNGELDVLYLLGADEIDTSGFKDCFVIYQGHHGDVGAEIADLILPGSAYTEKTATYVNTEGRAQISKKAVFAPGEAREDWKIIRALSEAMGRKLPYDSLAQLRRAMAENSFFRNTDMPFKAEWQEFGWGGDIANRDFIYPIRNYYMTDPISRASPTMAECTRVYVDKTQPLRTGTEG
jgi:NADH-quinone oxidoreductase subunit G